MSHLQNDKRHLQLCLSVYYRDTEKQKTDNISKSNIHIHMFIYIAKSPNWTNFMEL